MTNDSLNQLDTLYPLLTDSQLIEYSKLFRNDLTAALSNQQSSLPTILNPVAKMNPTPGFGVAVAIGGTNGYASSFRISSSGEIRFLNRQVFLLPEKTSEKDLFNLLAKNILLVASDRTKPFPIGIGIAYPLKPLLISSFIDGELLYMAKGRDIKGLVGKKIGQEFHKFLKTEYQVDTSISVANDAICLLLGGHDVEIAGVVGTGLNFAYWDKRSSIAPLKLSELQGFVRNEVAINIESKNFNKINGTKYRDMIDKTSDDKGYSLAEKEAAGAYMFKLFNLCAKEYISHDFPELSSTDEINDIRTLAFNYPIDFSIDLKKKARLLSDRIFHRSAQIVAIELCGVLQKIGKTDGIVPIVMEGGIFWKAKNYPSLVNSYINVILPTLIPSFARLFGSSRRGIAILARGGIS